MRGDEQKDFAMYLNLSTQRQNMHKTYWWYFYYFFFLHIFLFSRLEVSSKALKNKKYSKMLSGVI